MEVVKSGQVIGETSEWNYGALTNVRYLRGCHNREDAVKMRDGIMSYVNGVGEVEWQVAHVRRT